MIHRCWPNVQNCSLLIGALLLNSQNKVKNVTFQTEKWFPCWENRIFFSPGLTVFRISSLTKEPQLFCKITTLDQPVITPHLLVFGRGASGSPSYPTARLPAPLPRAAAAPRAPDTVPVLLRWTLRFAPSLRFHRCRSHRVTGGEDGDGYRHSSGSSVSSRCRRGDGRRWQFECFKLQYTDYFQRG